MSKVIGIDISKSSFDISFQEKKDEVFTHRKFKNDNKGFESFLSIINEHDHCVMEATGPYYLQLATFLHLKGLSVSVVNPLQIKHFVRMRMVKAKTDKKDAQMIALYGQVEKPDLWEPNEDQVNALLHANTAIELLLKQRTMISNQLEAFSVVPNTDKMIVKELRLLIKSIERKIKKLEDHMLEIVEKHYKQTFDSLRSIPGIGPKTALIFIAITNNFNKFDDVKKFASFVGLAPRIFESGTSIKGKGHITKMGNRYLRKLLYLCSWTAKTRNLQCKQMYERLKLKGKPEKVIKIAIANKLLRQAFAIGSKLSTYDKNYQKIFAF